MVPPFLYSWKELKEIVTILLLHPLKLALIQASSLFASKCKHFLIESMGSSVASLPTTEWGCQRLDFYSIKL
jgi:hypothetical protein